MKHLLQKRILDKVINVLSSYDFVNGIVLYGSYARGDFGPKSDIDVCVLISNVRYLTTTNDALAAIKTRRPIQPLIRSIAELLKTDATLLSDILKQGKILYWKNTVDIHVSTILKLKPYTIFSFSLLNKAHKTKVRFDYALYGKKADGLLSQYEGRKLSTSCVMVPYAHTKRIIRMFRQYDIKYERIDLWK